jgi:hypothetical protein
VLDDQSWGRTGKDLRRTRRAAGRRVVGGSERWRAVTRRGAR